MAKRRNNVRKPKQQDGDDISSSPNNFDTSSHSSNTTSQDDISLKSWITSNRLSIIVCLLGGALCGTCVGTCISVKNFSQSQYLLNFVGVGGCLDNIQEILHYIGLGGYLVTMRSKSVDEHSIKAAYKYVKVNGRSVRDYPSHPLTYAILRESIIRIKGGFVHPDLGVLVPAPCGAPRGLGMVRDAYNSCQTRCMPGTISEKLQVRNQGTPSDSPPHWKTDIRNVDTNDKLNAVLDEQEQSEEKYRQEEVLLRIPLQIQMTRTLALETLIPLIPYDVLARIPLVELDDAALLVLLLAHEHGKGIRSIFHPYIASLPLNPSCGFSPQLRKEALETISFMGVNLGMDVNGWPGELTKAGDRANVIAYGLTRDYGSYIQVPKGETPFTTLQWALCNVASRATAASEKHGALRLIPLLDMINHEVNAGGFEELLGKEQLRNGNFVDATEEDSGTFVVRSVLNGRRKILRKGQELLVNYNVPKYSPLDWFLSLGFVPPERSNHWTKVERALPKSRTFSN
jgi:hypothetical protein